MSPTAPRRTVLLGTAAAALLLLLAAPTPAASVRTLRDTGSATDQAAPLLALLSLLAWLLAGWLLVTLAVTAGSHLPGGVGRLLAAVSRRLAPTTVRKAVEVALGLTVAVGVLGASPAAAAPGPAGGPAAPAGVSLDWAAPAPQSPPVAPPAQDLDWAAPATPDTAVAATPTPDAVVVQPGDSLWALAEQDLAARGQSTTDAAVARAWPTWWAANRDVVGDDPDLLQPGMPLAPPADGRTPPASS